MYTAGDPVPSAGTTHTSVSALPSRKPVQGPIAVQPLHLIVDTAGLGQLDVAPGGQVEHVQPPPHQADPMLVSDPGRVWGHGGTLGVLPDRAQLSSRQAALDQPRFPRLAA